jgi:hypothetical protein
MLPLREDLSIHKPIISNLLSKMDILRENTMQGIDDSNISDLHGSFYALCSKMCCLFYQIHLRPLHPETVAYPSNLLCGRWKFQKNAPVPKSENKEKTTALLCLSEPRQMKQLRGCTDKGDKAERGAASPCKID